MKDKELQSLPIEKQLEVWQQRLASFDKFDNYYPPGTLNKNQQAKYDRLKEACRSEINTIKKYIRELED